MEHHEPRREPPAGLPGAGGGARERHAALSAPEAADLARDRLLASVELLAGLGMVAGFVLILLVPATARLVAELPWMLGSLQVPQLGINPHYTAGARQVPSLLVLGACAALLVCYRWLASRRRH